MVDNPSDGGCEQWTTQVSETVRPKEYRLPVQYIKCYKLNEQFFRIINEIEPLKYLAK